MKRAYEDGWTSNKKFIRAINDYILLMHFKDPKIIRELDAPMVDVITALYGIEKQKDAERIGKAVAVEISKML